MRKSLIALALAGAASTSPLVWGQADVVDSEPLDGDLEAPSENEEGTSNLQAELFYQLQALQQEVQQLRGEVEEQSHEIRRLKKQRMEDYLDLDRRLAELRGMRPGGDDSDEGDESGEPDERATQTEMYRQAYELLRERNIDEAIDAFNDYLDVYPEGNFAGNCHYWLGEIYLLQEDLDQAQEWFERLLEQFPDDRKRQDAMYKLGRVYHQQGKDEQARETLNEVASGVNDAARLARQYLKENF